eukprot:5503618-Prymnesium_polylepis.1
MAACGYLERAAAQLLSAPELRLPFAEQLSLLETRLGDRSAMLDATQQPEANLELLVSEERLFDGSGPRSGDRADDDTLSPLAEEPFKQAII